MHKRVLTVLLLSVCVTKLVACVASDIALEQEFFGTPAPSPHIKLAGGAGFDPVKAPSASPSPLVINNEIVAVTPESITEPLKRIQLTHVFPNISYPRMVHLTYPEDGSGRLFLLLQHGQIVVFPNKEETTYSSTFLDISGYVNDSENEEGLLGIAFDPDYSTNGFFYVYYSATSPRRSATRSLSRKAPARSTCWSYCSAGIPSSSSGSGRSASSCFSPSAHRSDVSDGSPGTPPCSPRTPPRDWPSR